MGQSKSQYCITLKWKECVVNVGLVFSNPTLTKHVGFSQPNMLTKPNIFKHVYTEFSV